jgi:hypothetical protein
MLCRALHANWAQGAKPGVLYCQQLLAYCHANYVAECYGTHTDSVTYAGCFVMQREVCVVELTQAARGKILSDVLLVYHDPVVHIQAVSTVVDNIQVELASVDFVLYNAVDIGVLEVVSLGRKCCYSGLIVAGDACCTLFDFVSVDACVCIDVAAQYDVRACDFLEVLTFVLGCCLHCCYIQYLCKRNTRVCKCLGYLLHGEGVAVAMQLGGLLCLECCEL